MYTVLLVVLIFAAVFFIALSFLNVVMDRRGNLARRLKEIDRIAMTHEIKDIAVAAEETGEEEDKIGLPAARESQKKGFLTERYFHWLSDKLQKARLLYHPREYFLLSLGTAFFVIVFMILAFAGKYQGLSRGLGLVVLILTSGALGFMLPNVYLSFREKKFHGLLSYQVGDMILLLANYLRAGHSFIRSMELVSREISPPLADELKTFTKDMNLGASMAAALEDLEKRTQDEDLGLVLTAIQINHQIGGNLAEILDTINHTIRERIRLKGEIRTLTAQGRLTAIVISLLPVAVAFIIFYLHPSFMKVLFNEPAGQLMLMIAVVMEAVGIVIIRRIVQIEV